jgi:2-methylcitrate dehydratase PrpD
MVLQGYPPGPEWITDAVLQDEELIAYSRRVKVTIDPELNAKFYETRRTATRVVITTKSGASYTAYSDIPPGDPAKPMRSTEIEAKFVSLASPVVGDKRAKAIVSKVRALADVDDLSTLTDLCRPSEA